MLHKEILLDNEDFAQLKFPMQSNMRLKMLTFKDGVLSSTIQCQNRDDVANYVDMLKAMGHFENVTYYGWENESQYNFQVYCQLG